MNNRHKDKTQEDTRRMSTAHPQDQEAALEAQVKALLEVHQQMQAALPFPAYRLEYQVPNPA